MKELFVSNREKIMNRLEGGLIVMSAYTDMQRGNDMAARFEQESNFWWLSGVEVADWWLIIDGTHRKTWLVAPTISESHAIFDGSLSMDHAREISGVDEVLTRDEAKSLLREQAKKHSVVYTLGDQPHAEHFNFVINPAQKRMYEQLERTFISVRDCRKELAQLRAIKDDREIVAMKKAIDLTIDAFQIAKTNLAAKKYEYEVEADFSYHIRSSGAKGHAYDPIVASGKNACTLHYVDNMAKLKKRELLLIDIGARHFGYAADITRTYALGEPTKRQRAVHAAVQTAQQAVIGFLKPDLSIEQYQREVDAIMTESLMSLGLMTGPNDEKSYRKYFPHAISHGLGVDVHDSLGGPRFLQPGMVLTVEPGIYIPEEGIGVRIEDDILITGAGHTNLSAGLSTDL